MFREQRSESIRAFRRFNFLQRTLRRQRRVVRVHERELLKISVRRDARRLLQSGPGSSSCCNSSRGPRRGVAKHWVAQCRLLLRYHARRLSGAGTTLEDTRLMILWTRVGWHHCG